MFDEDQEPPNTLVVNDEFSEHGKKQLIVFETRHWISSHAAGIGDNTGKPGGNAFFGSKGYMAINGYTQYSCSWEGTRNPDRHTTRATTTSATSPPPSAVATGAK